MSNSCKITTAPINVPSTVAQEGGEHTNFFFDYGKSPCSVTNKTTYLDIMCFDGTNKVSCGITGDLVVTGVRLYQPSLNTYSGSKQDAELIITHSGGGKNLYVCVPITSSRSVGGTSEWFSQVIPFSPNKKNSSVSVNVSNFTLNTVIPKTSYLIYEGGTFDWGCSKQDVMIIFSKDNSISMLSKDLSTLKKLISPASYNVQDTPHFLKLNNVGTQSGAGRIPGSEKSDTLTCTPVTDENGNNIENTDTTSWTSNNSLDVGSRTEKFLKTYWYIFLGILLGAIVIVLLIFSLRKVKSLVGGNNSTSTSNG